MLPFPQDLVGGSREVRRGIAGVARLAYLLAFPSLPPTLLGKYQFQTLVFPVQCCVDRCLEVGCGSVALVTYLLLRRLLPSSVATFKAPTLQYSVGLEFNKYGIGILWAVSRTHKHGTFARFHLCGISGSQTYLFS